MIERFGMHFAPGMEERVISVCLPRGYGQSDESYPVMYMFDGQNAFEPEASAYGSSWNLHEFVDGWEKNVIVVGIESSPESDRRLAEYCPFHLAPRTWEGLRGRGRATMEWIAGTLKPEVDSRYRTLPDRLCTGVVGSGMGGLMSLYAVSAFNGVFSKAACLSPELSSGYAQMLRQVREGPVDANSRIYLSVGENEARDKSAMAHRADQMLTIANGFMDKGARVCPVLVRGGRACEADWGAQTERFMRFLWLDP